MLSIQAPSSSPANPATGARGFTTSSASSRAWSAGCISASGGSMRENSQGSTMNKMTTGTTLKGESNDSRSGMSCPVTFCTILSAEPGVAWASAMELESPGGNITNPEYAPASNQAKSSLCRLAISRANMAEAIRPKPQLNATVVSATSTVSATASRGVLGKLASQRNAAETGFELVSA